MTVTSAYYGIIADLIYLLPASHQINKGNNLKSCHTYITHNQYPNWILYQTETCETGNTGEIYNEPNM